MIGTPRSRQELPSRVSLDRIRPGAWGLAATLLVAWVAGSLCQALAGIDLEGWLSCTSAGLLRGELWRLLTWPLAGTVPSAWTLFCLVFSVGCASALEEELGRRALFRLLTSSCLLVALVALVQARLGLAFELPGPWLVTASIFGGYCALFPQGVIRILFLVPVVCSLLFGISVVAVLGLAKALWLPHWAALLLPYFMVTRRWGLGLRRAARVAEAPARPRRKSRLDESFKGPKVTPLHSPRGLAPVAAGSEVDRIIDKLQHEGMGALTAEERALLDASSSRGLGRNSQDPRGSEQA